MRRCHLNLNQPTMSRSVYCGTCLILPRPARFEDAVTLSQGLIRTIGALRMPDQSGQIGLFVSQMERVGQLFQELFGSTQTIVRSMDTLYDVMTDTGQWVPRQSSVLALACHVVGIGPLSHVCVFH